MLLRYSFKMNTEADAVETAVNKTLEAGFRTGDIMSEGMTLVSCSEMGTKISDNI